MKIRIEAVEDSLLLRDGKICATVDGKEYRFELAEIEAVLIITSDMGPFYDDMCLAIRVDEETAIFIMSEHPSYKAFLFDQLGKEISLNYEKIIEASICTDNNVFVLYKKGG